MADYWRGVRVCSCMVAPLNAVGANVTKRCKAQGIPDFYLSPIQGSYSTSTAASAGTHAGGGAIDINTRPLTPAQKAVLEFCMREVTFADWDRPVTWFSKWFNKIINGGWSPHNHGILTGCVHLSSAAKSQVAEYVKGENGLVGGDKDTGTRSFVGRTWAAYLAIQKGVASAAQRALMVPTVKKLQAAIYQTQDGSWGPVTDAFLWRTGRIRREGKAGFMLYGVDKRKAMQGSWGAKPVDGIWGPRTQAANVAAVKRIQAVLKVTQDGVWGPKTDAAWRAVRAKAYAP